jgi:small-conductance mechanosensitive channel
LPLAGKAVRRALPLLALILGAPALSVSPALAEVVRNGTSLLLIGVVAFILFQIVDAATTFVLSQHRLDVSDNLQARSIYTQVVVLKKVAVTVIGVFTLASMLMVFDSVRQFGASILASAGIAGIVIGFAAQRSIATLLAGFQIALTQPIRLDDVVIVENEWGRIEDITLTYVVVRVWDLRRLVVPITYFIEQPFQNWTRSSADILGTVFIYVDYGVPLEALRGELTRLLEASRYWDGKVNVLQVTDAKEHTLEIRALASAADASLAWDLRCEIREKLVAFIQQKYPESLPRFRASLDARLPNAEPARDTRAAGHGG